MDKKLNAIPPLDPDVVKALIASESDFREDPPGNPKATGIIQITSETFANLQNPNFNIPMGIRWLYRKKRLAEGKLDRIQQKCLFLDAEAENQWRHQYFMYVLNDKNEVLEIMQSTNQDKDSCQIQLNKIEKILKPESLVKLCVRGELKKNVPQSEDQGEFIKFGTLGGHKVVYEALTLDSICNSKECFSNNDVWVNACPGFVKY